MHVEMNIQYNKNENEIGSSTKLKKLPLLLQLGYCSLRVLFLFFMSCWDEVRSSKRFIGEGFMLRNSVYFIDYLYRPNCKLTSFENVKSKIY